MVLYVERLEGFKKKAHASAREFHIFLNHCQGGEQRANLVWATWRIPTSPYLYLEIVLADAVYSDSDRCIVTVRIVTKAVQREGEVVQKKIG